VVIDGGIIVTVTSVDGGTVKLGFAAPFKVKIWRSEMLDGQDISRDRYHNSAEITNPVCRNAEIKK
jgi:carbon storage regulator CsrA